MNDYLIYLVLGGVLTQCGLSLGRYLERKKYGNQLYENYMKSNFDALGHCNRMIELLSKRKRQLNLRKKEIAINLYLNQIKEIDDDLHYYLAMVKKYYGK